MNKEQSRNNSEDMEVGENKEEHKKLMGGGDGDQELERGTQRVLIPTPRHSMFVRLGSAVFYGFSSVLIMIVNKDLLTEKKFPSALFLGFCQMLATILILGTCRTLKFISFPLLSVDIVRKIFPLPLFYLGNMVAGLGSTKELSLPMMTALRRFSIWFTMLSEQYLLKIKQTVEVKLSVFVMIFGAIVAALGDLAFSSSGYSYVMLNNICTAGNNVVTKKKLDSKEVGKYGLLFYGGLLMIFPMFMLNYLTGDLDKALAYHNWNDGTVILEFFLSCVFALILNLATLLCTQYNTPLTTTIVGCLKNIFITYIGMFINSDYIFSFANFTGVTISVLGSLYYTKVTFTDKIKTPRNKDATNQLADK